MSKILRGGASIVIGVMTVLHAAWTAAKEPNPPFVSQLSHRTWRTSDGTLPLPPTSIAPTPDGYIWIGTDAGLLRFDGARFMPVPEMPPRPVLSLLVDRDRSVWIGTTGSLHHMTSSGVTDLQTPTRTNQIVQANDGTVWLANSRHGRTEQGPDCRIEREHVVCTGKPLDDGKAVSRDFNDGAWIIEDEWKNLCHVSEGPPQCIHNDQPDLGLKGDLFEMTEATPNGLLVAHKNDNGSPRIGRLNQQRLEDLGVLPGATASTEVSSMRASAGGDEVWIGTSDRGLYRFADGKFQNYSSKDGLSSDAVADIEIDNEHSIWVVTTVGIDQFYRRPVESWSMKEGLTADSVSSIDVGNDGRVYLGNQDGLDVIDHGEVTSYRTGKSLPGRVVQGMHVDEQNTLWLGVDSKLWKFRDGKFTDAGVPMRMPAAYVWLTQDSAGTYIFNYGRGEYRMSPGELSLFDFMDEYPAVTDYAIDPAGGYWREARGRAPAHFIDESFVEAGTPPPKDVRLGNPLVMHWGYLWSSTNVGLFVWKDGHYKVLGPANGLTFQSASEVIFDANENLWVMTERGYVEIPADDVKAWLGDDHAKVRTLELGFSDGARPGLSTFAKGAVLAPNGDLWFATDKFAQHISPRSLGLNAHPPGVQIEQVSADGTAIDVKHGQILSPHPHTTQVDYTAFSFINPMNMRFRYKLDGVDTDWQDPQSRRQAIYTDLPPGHFSFHVIAANCDGVWNNDGATLDFSVQPAFYQTWWFRALVLIAFAMLLVMFYQYRKAQLTREVRGRLFERLAERERIARDLHDTFFQGIQGLLLRFQTGVSTMRRDDPARAHFIEVLDQSDRVMLEGRELVLDLRERLDSERPLEDVLKAVGDDLNDLYAARFALTIDGNSRPLRGDVRDEIFRIGKEAIFNAFRHAEANQIAVALTYGDDAFALVVSDNGKGIDSTVLSQGRRPGHWGLPGMQERSSRIGATIELKSEPGRGTRLELRIPGKIAYGKNGARSA